MSLVRKDNTQKYLKKQISNGNVVLVGATTDPKTRLSAHKREGFTGVMVYAETGNMKSDENVLLKKCKTCHLNIQKYSNVPAGDYIIMTLVRQNNTQAYLKEQIHKGNVVRVGATKNPDILLLCTVKDMYTGIMVFTGTMVFAKTRNMKSAKNALLEECKTCRLNVLSSSYVRAEKGYVYIIMN